MSKKKKESFLSFADQLSSMVYYNRKAAIDGEGEDYIRIRVNLKLSFWMRLYKKLFPVMRDYKIYLLSDFSYRIFSLIREHGMSLNDLITHLRDTEKLSFFEARNLMVQYVGMLMQRGIAVIELPTSADTPRREREE